MKRIRMDEDYYLWTCEWCDTVNRVLWARVAEGLSCGACHKRAYLGGEGYAEQELKICSGLF